MKNRFVRFALSLAAWCGGAVFLLSTAFLMSTAACAQPDAGATTAEPSSDVARLLLESINDDRRAAGAEPLVWERRLLAACRAVADRVTDEGIDSIDFSAALDEELGQRGYQISELQLGFGQMAGEPAQVVAAWRRGAPATFEAFTAPALRHVGFGLGFDYGVPSYVLAAAVEQGDALESAAKGLDDLAAVRRQVLRDVNRAREEANLRPFRADKALDRVAQGYAEDMLRRGYYGHESPEGEDVRDRVSKARLILQRVGENVASGQPSADEVVTGWLNSPPHRANILHRRFSHHGLGVAAGRADDGSFQIRWVQIFASYH